MEAGPFDVCILVIVGTDPFDICIPVIEGAGPFDICILVTVIVAGEEVPSGAACFRPVWVAVIESGAVGGAELGLEVDGVVLSRNVYMAGVLWSPLRRLWSRRVSEWADRSIVVAGRRA